MALPSAVNLAGWQEHSRCPSPLFHDSSHGRCEQIDETAETASPLRKTKAPTPPAVTRLPSPSLNSSIPPTSTQRALSGSMGATGLAAAFGSSARLRKPPPAAPAARPRPATSAARRVIQPASGARSEEHTSELQSPYDLVCRLLLEKKKIY